MPTLGFAMCGSFCTLSKALEQMERLRGGYAILPVMSQNTYETDTRFGTAVSFIQKAQEIAGRPVLHTHPRGQSPSAPRAWWTPWWCAPAPATTLSKLGRRHHRRPGEPWRWKSSLRTGTPVVLCCATNDAMAASGPNLLRLLNTKHVYLVPLRQDDPVKKPVSLVADFSLHPQTVALALEGKQLQPVFLPPHTGGLAGQGAPASQGVPGAVRAAFPVHFPPSHAEGARPSCRGASFVFPSPAKAGKNFFLYISPVLGYHKRSAAVGPRLRNLGKKRGETMLYCAKCHGVCEDATAKCPNCKSSKLRPVTGDDFVLLHRVDQYTAQRLEPLFQEHGVAYRLEPFDGGPHLLPLRQRRGSPPDRMVLARWGDYPTAQGLARQAGPGHRAGAGGRVRRGGLRGHAPKEAGHRPDPLRGRVPRPHRPGGVRRRCRGQLGQGPVPVILSVPGPCPSSRSDRRQIHPILERMDTMKAQKPDTLCIHAGYSPKNGGAPGGPHRPKHHLRLRELPGRWAPCSTSRRRASSTPVWATLPRMWWRRRSPLWRAAWGAMLTSSGQAASLMAVLNICPRRLSRGQLQRHLRRHLQPVL